MFDLKDQEDFRIACAMFIEYLLNVKLLDTPEDKEAVKTGRRNEELRNYIE